MNHQETLRYLDELAGSGMKLGLEPMHRLLTELGNPQNTVPTLHVAGSNGKGSTAAFLASIFSAADYHVGLYTSPHLVAVEERIELDRQPIAPEPFAAAATYVRHRVDRLLASAEIPRPPTYFEFLTAVAFHVFRQDRCDLMVVETGLGGRLDATNVVEKPLACLITRVDLEHSEHLGESLEEIAREKAGILRPGVPAVTFERRPETLAALREAARSTGCTLVEAAAGFQARTAPDGTITIKVGRSTFHGLTVPLPGEHQVENLALALATADVLGKRGFALDPDHVRLGVEMTSWPGRLEVVRTNPTVLLDGAHNPAGAQALAAYLASTDSSGRLFLVFGAMRDKDIPGIMEPLLPRAERVFLTRAAVERAADLDTLEKAAKPFRRDVVAVSSPGDALDQALALAGPGDTILVTGSLLLVGDVKRLLEARSAS